MVKTEAYTIPEDCDFRSVSHQFVKNSCSPKLVDRKFRGVAINAPNEIIYEQGHQEPFGGFAFIPICGMYVHAAGEPPNEEMPDALVLVAVDTVSKQAYSGKYVQPGVQLPPPSPLQQIETPPGSVRVTGYFNFNLAEVVGLPEKPAEYIVYVTAGPYKSNVRMVKIMQKKE